MRRAIAEEVWGRAAMTKSQALELVDLVLELIERELLRSGRAHVDGFGVFRVTTRKARNVRNPKTGELMWLPATRSVAFRPARELAKRIPNPQSPKE